MVGQICVGPRSASVRPALRLSLESRAIPTSPPLGQTLGSALPGSYPSQNLRETGAALPRPRPDRAMSVGWRSAFGEVSR